jgi:hypothetical protein
VTPDDFVRDLMASGVVAIAVLKHRTSLKNPSFSIDEYLDALRRNGLPDTATALVGAAI